MGRIVAPGDPAWTDEDTALALEYQDWTAQNCPGCGHHLSESASPDNEYAYVAHDQVCFACQAKEERVKALQETENAVTAGRKIGVALRPEHD